MRKLNFNINTVVACVPKDTGLVEILLSQGEFWFMLYTKICLTIQTSFYVFGKITCLYKCLKSPESIYLVLNTQFYQPRNLLKGTLILWKCFKAILYNGFAVKLFRLKYRRFNHILNLLYNTVFGIQPQKQRILNLHFSLAFKSPSPCSTFKFPFVFPLLWPSLCCLFFLPFSLPPPNDISTYKLTALFPEFES